MFIYMHICIYVYIFMYVLAKCINCINCKLSKGVNPKYVFAVICHPVFVIFKIVDVPRLIISD